MTDQGISSVAFLGVGSMNGAILAGVVKSGLVDGTITTTNRSASRAAALREDYGDRVTAYAEEVEPNANILAVRDAAIVVLGVKPYQLADVLGEIAPELTNGAIVVSVAAGISLDSMRAALPARDDVSLVRVMPNTPAFVGAAVTGLAAESNVGESALVRIETLFRTVGKVVRVTEAQLNNLGAISGSGPAYFYLFTEQLTVVARGMGFPEDTAKLLAESTFVGSALLLQQSSEPPEELRRQVTSPGGTTAEAVASFERDGLGAMIERAIAAALRRSAEIAEGK